MPTATAGATITGPTYPPRWQDIGPFKSSAGNIYTILRPTTTTFGAYKATDPMSSFSNVGANVSAGADVEAIDVFQVGDILHVAVQTVAGNVYYRQFSMAIDAWTGTLEPVHAAPMQPGSGMPAVSIVVRSTGAVVVMYCTMGASMATYARIWYGIRAAGGSTWAAGVAVDAGGSFQWTGTTAILGASDRVHFFYKDLGVGVYQRTLSASNVLQTAQASYGSMNHSGIPHCHNNGVTYVDGATTRVRVPAWIIDTTGGGYYCSLAQMDSVDSPGLPTAIRDIAPGAASPGIQHIASLDYRNGTLYYGLSSPYGHNEDLWEEESTDGGTTWTWEEPVWTGLTVNRFSSNILNRGGADVYAFIVEDAGTVRYGEATFDVTAPAVPTGLVHSIITVSD